MIFENVDRSRNPRAVAGGGSRVGETAGELGRLEPMVNLVLDLRLSLDLCVRVGNGEGVLDDFARSDDGCKNGGENGGENDGENGGGGDGPLSGLCNRLSDELRCRLKGVGCGWGFKY